MSGTLRNALIAAGAAAALILAPPALAGEEREAGMMGGDSGMMMGQGGMGMMKGGGKGGMSGNMGMMQGGGKGGMPGGMMMKVMHALDLDEDQAREMTSIHKEMAEKRAGAHVELQYLHRQMAQEMGKERPDAEEVGRIYDRIAAEKKSMLQGKARAHNEMMDVLSAEQRQRLQEMKQKKREKMKKGGMGMGKDCPMKGGDEDND